MAEELSEGIYVNAFDPDLHHLGYARLFLCGGEIDVIDVRTLKVSKTRKGERAVRKMIQEIREFSKVIKPADALVVEGQQFYKTAKGKKINPHSLLWLGQVAGACAMLPGDSLYFPRPVEWKKTVEKPIHQARTLTKLGWGYKQTKNYSRPLHPPEEFGSILAEEWKHIVDAIGLALWAGEQELKKRRRG